MVYTNIKLLCVKSGITVADLEKKVGIGAGAISKWRNHAPNAFSLKKVADFFGCTVDDLLREDSA